MDQYETIERLGLGACGAVYLVRHKQTKRLFALKKIEIDERRKTRTQQYVLKEASILSSLKHPHIVAFHDSFLQEGGQHVCIMQDYCDGGTLSDRIQEATSKNIQLAEKQIMQWFIQILMAVQYIHSKKVLHRDLKTENVFLTRKNVVKIGDFGISKILDSTIDVAKTVVGTPSYLSPELCQDIPYNSKSDIWALGCLLYEMCALHPPFDGHSLISLFFKIVKAEFEPPPSCYSEGIHELIHKLLVKAPEDRPSASAVLNMPFVKDHLLYFIHDTETLKQQRSANSSASGAKSQDASAEGSPLKPPSASPRAACKKVAELKCSPLAQSVEPSHKLDVITCKQMGAESDKPPAERGDVDSDYSDDFDESSESEIEEEIQAEKAGSGAASEEEANYADDFEEYDSAEELEEVLTQAREAQDLQPADDYFEDHRDDEDELAATLTQSSFIKSCLSKPHHDKQPADTLTLKSTKRPQSALNDTKNKNDRHWINRTCPDS